MKDKPFDYKYYEKLWYSKNDSGISYNFEPEPSTEDFSFIEFTSTGSKSEYDEFGAFVVITNKQYIIDYNPGLGTGPHRDSFATTMSQIKGVKKGASDVETGKLSTECTMNYICARIIFEKTNEGHSGYINFTIPKTGITEEQFAVFEQFYNDYNHEINVTCKKYGLEQFCVTFMGTDENGQKKRYISDNLDQFKQYLSEKINYDKTPNETFSEIIIGKTPTSSNRK